MEGNVDVIVPKLESGKSWVEKTDWKFCRKFDRKFSRKFNPESGGESMSSIHPASQIPKGRMDLGCNYRNQHSFDPVEVVEAVIEPGDRIEVSNFVGRNKTL